MTSERTPCGSWPSPITASALTAGQVSISEPRFDADDLGWLEGRPSERGRSVLMNCRRDGTAEEVLPDTFYVRSRVHEYGGGSWVPRRGVKFFCDFPTQRLFRKDAGSDARPLTSEPGLPASHRYADMSLSPDGEWIAAVRERHGSGSVANDLVILPADGSAEPQSLVSGHDFFSFPMFSPDGSRLLWTSWDHPRMPWDGTDLWVAELGPDRTLREPRHLAGGPDECIFQPQWGPSGEIYFVSDRTGWGNLYRLHPGRGGVVPLLPMEAEFGLPQWVFGMSRYGLLEGGRIVAACTRAGDDQVVVLDTATGRYESWDVGYSGISALTSNGADTVALVGGGPTTAPELSVGLARGPLSVVRRTLEFSVDPGYLSTPEHIEFPTTGGRSAYAFFYPPVHEEREPEVGEKPPLIVTSHGGPTAAAVSVLNLGVQFWTSRGFGIVDVNYAGSTGYGRPYMESLRGCWGERDVEDCVRAAEHLAGQGRADSARMVIRGKSASGLTTLGALVFHDVFRAGASYYGVADLEGLARDTHKFESRYMDSLIGPYPEARDLYRSRSPLEHANRLAAPVIFFQGLDDRVVPPSQAESLIRVLRDKKLPYAYLSFEGEQHGFRQASTVRRSLEAELFFYSKILRFTPADTIEPVPIENL